jgi:phosphoadenosine phosphosulfate reductase
VRILSNGKELVKKVNKSIEYLRTFNKADEPYYLCYSGGKDSDTIRILAELADVNYEVHNNHTTVDSPTTVYYIREVMSAFGERERVQTEQGEIIYKYGDRGFIHMPPRSMWQLIVAKGFPPSRFARYCCQELKERGGRGRRKITGVRWAESNNRKENQGLVTIVGMTKTTEKIAIEQEVDYIVNKHGGIILNTDNDKERRVVEACYRTTTTMINPIIDWTDDEVWEFLHYYGCKSNPEYACGECRAGCIACPLAGGKKQKEEFIRYPKYRNSYLLAFDRMLKKREADGKVNFDIAKRRYWKDAESVMRWWVGDDPLQITIEDYMKYLEEQQAMMEEYET